MKEFSILCEWSLWECHGVFDSLFFLQLVICIEITSFYECFFYESHVVTLSSLKQPLSNNRQCSFPAWTAKCALLFWSLKGHWVGTSHVFNLFPAEHPPLMGFLCSWTCAAQQKHHITGSGWTIYSLLK